MIICRSLAVIKRCLTAVDKLEDTGLVVSNLRADLSALADMLETEARALALERRQEARLKPLEGQATCEVKYEN